MNDVKANPVRWGLWKIGLVAAVVSAIANLLLMMVTKPYLDVPDSFGPLAVFPIIFWSDIGAFGAIGVYGLVRKFSSDPHKVFMIIGSP